MPSILFLFVIGVVSNYLLHPTGFIGYVFSLLGKQHVLFFCEGIFIAEHINLLKN